MSLVTGQTLRRTGFLVSLQAEHKWLALLSTLPGPESSGDRAILLLALFTIVSPAEKRRCLVSPCLKRPKIRWDRIYIYKYIYIYIYMYIYVYIYIYIYIYYTVTVVLYLFCGDPPRLYTAHTYCG